LVAVILLPDSSCSRRIDEQIEAAQQYSVFEEKELMNRQEFMPSREPVFWQRVSTISSRRLPMIFPKPFV
jgi:hypothetical protein